MNQSLFYKDKNSDLLNEKDKLLITLRENKRKLERKMCKKTKLSLIFLAYMSLFVCTFIYFFTTFSKSASEFIVIPLSFLSACIAGSPMLGISILRKKEKQNSLQELLEIKNKIKLIKNIPNEVNKNLKTQNFFISSINYQSKRSQLDSIKLPEANFNEIEKIIYSTSLNIESLKSGNKVLNLKSLSAISLREHFEYKVLSKTLDEVRAQSLKNKNPKVNLNNKKHWP